MEELHIFPFFDTPNTHDSLFLMMAKILYVFEDDECGNFYVENIQEANWYSKEAFDLTFCWCTSNEWIARLDKYII